MLTEIAGAAGSSVGAESNTIYVIIASIILVAGAVAAVFRYYNRQKDHWQQEGRQRAEQSAATENNSRKLEENSAAMKILTKKLDEFVTSVRSELVLFDGRLSKLERWREAHHRQLEEERRDIRHEHPGP